MTNSESKKYITEQESFWAGEFGSNYIDRNRGQSIISSNLAFFSRALKCVRGVESVIEFGANIGLNLQALHQLLPTTKLSAIEINSDAAHILHEWINQIPGGGRFFNRQFLIGRHH